jgi:hypothetical protein
MRTADVSTIATPRCNRPRIYFKNKNNIKMYQLYPDKIAE